MYGKRSLEVSSKRLLSSLASWNKEREREREKVKKRKEKKKDTCSDRYCASKEIREGNRQRFSRIFNRIYPNEISWSVTRWTSAQIKQFLTRASREATRDTSSPKTVAKIVLCADLRGMFLPSRFDVRLCVSTIRSSAVFCSRNTPAKDSVGGAARRRMPSLTKTSTQHRRTVYDEPICNFSSFEVTIVWIGSLYKAFS